MTTGASFTSTQPPKWLQLTISQTLSQRGKVLGKVSGPTPRGSHVPPEINLAELQKTLDTQGIEVVNNQKESLVGRKALADRTRGT